MDARERTQELLARGDTVDEIVRELRDEGFTIIESMSALIKSGSLSFADAKAAVVDSPVWADQRDQVTTKRWVDAPELPDANSVERLRQACSELSRVAEAWVTGSEMTRNDGSSELSTAIAIVLDPPATDLLDPGELATVDEIVTRLEAAWSPTGRRSWLWVSREIIAGEKEHCLPIYART